MPNRTLVWTHAALVLALTATPAPAQDAPPAAAWAGPHHFRPVARGEPTRLACDVAVYGGTPASVAAAIQAARMGKVTLLLSFDQHVGGLTSGGLTATDIGDEASVGGIARSTYERIGIRGFSPSRAEAQFRAMLDEAGVTVLLTRPLESARVEDARVRCGPRWGGPWVPAGECDVTTRPMTRPRRPSMTTSRAGRLPRRRYMAADSRGRSMADATRLRIGLRSRVRKDPRTTWTALMARRAWPGAAAAPRGQARVVSRRS
jgi:hypothetical protein